MFGNPTKWNLRRARKKFSCKKAYKFCLHSGEKKKQRIPKGLKRFTRDNRKQLEKMVKKIQSLPKGKLKKGDKFIHESIIGSKFTGTVEDEVTIGEKPAIIPGIEGWAVVTGYNTIIIDDEEDPYAFGFQVL